MLKTTYKQILAGLLGFALLLTACSTSFDLYDTSSSSGDGTITSLNSYVDLINAGYDATELLSDDVYYYNTDLENYDALLASGLSPEFTCNFYIYDKTNIYETVLIPSSNLTLEEQSLLIEKALLMMNSLDDLDMLCMALESYIYDEAYLEDNFVDSDAYLEALYSEYDIYLDAHNDMLKYVNGLFEIYETFEVDLNDPNSIAIHNIRTTISLAEDALDLSKDVYETEDFTLTQNLSDIYKELDGFMADHTAHYYNIKDSSTATYYDYYYTDLSDYYLPGLKQVIVDANNQDLENLDLNYSYLLDYYNYLIDDYNYFLDVVPY